MVSITLGFINSEELFSDSTNEAVLPLLNASRWVNTFSITVAVLCTKSERLLPDSLFSYACQLSSPWGQTRNSFSFLLECAVVYNESAAYSWQMYVFSTIHCLLLFIVSQWTMSENWMIFYVIPHRQDHTEFQASVHLIYMYFVTYNSGNKIYRPMVWMLTILELPLVLCV